MNIFALDTDPHQAAKYLDDKRVIKMILESAQLLSTAWWVLEPRQSEHLKIYKKTHAQHPCAVWVRESSVNYGWLMAYLEGLLAEYRYRYGKTHATTEIYQQLIKVNICPVIRRPGTPFRQVMPVEYQEDDAITAYRRYYAIAKAPMSTWTRRDAPHWLNAVLNEL